MSDDIPSPVVLSVNESSSGVTAGSLLKAAREREGLHIAALAVSMKVPVKKLEALEANRLDLLPDAVFVRALASSVCRALKLDPGPILQLLPNNTPSRLVVDDRGINTPFESQGQGSSLSLSNLLKKPTVLMVLVLMAAAVGVYFYPQASRDMVASDALQPLTPSMAFESPSAAVEAPAAMLKSLVHADEPVLAAPVQSLPTVSTPTVAEQSPSTVPVLAMAPSANLQQPVIDTTKPAATASTPVGDAVLVFKAKGQAWIQVTDAKGLQLLSRTLQPSEVVGISGVLPLSVVVGRADLTTVELRGKAIDLSAIAQNNVARFEVKP